MTEVRPGLRDAPESFETYSEGRGGQLFLGTKEKEKYGTRAEYYRSLKKSLEVATTGLPHSLRWQIFHVGQGINIASGIKIHRTVNIKVLKKAILF